MKQFFLIGILASFFSFFVWSFQSRAAITNAPQLPLNFQDKNNDRKNKQPVLVELYTAIACPACPPADRNLAFLEKEQPFAEAEVITLALHVDYRDSGGRRDEFSSPMFTRRQDIYRQAFNIGSIFTPQMIVDGQSAFVGSDLSKVQKSIIENAKKEKGKIELSAAEEAKGGVNLKAKISELPAHENATIFLAIAEDNLDSKDRRGANSNNNLEYIPVVRELKSLGFLTAEQKNLETEIFLQLQPNWKSENLKFVVFLQENRTRRILGVNALKIKTK